MRLQASPGPVLSPPSELRVRDQQQETISHGLQESDHVCVAVFTGQIHGPTVRIVPGLRVRLVLHQQPHRVQVARPGRVVQRGGPGAAVRHVGIRSVVQQHLRHRRAAHHHHLCDNTTTGTHTQHLKAGKKNESFIVYNEYYRGAFRSREWMVKKNKKTTLDQMIILLSRLY